MIKQMHVAICDACGKCVPAIQVGNQRDFDWCAPDDWKKGAHNPDVHFCPECAKKLSVSNTTVKYQLNPPGTRDVRTTVDAMLE